MKEERRFGKLKASFRQGIITSNSAIAEIEFGDKSMPGAVSVFFGPSRLNNIINASKNIIPEELNKKLKFIGVATKESP